jgi:addiction module RelE/StbE family toxin
MQVEWQPEARAELLHILDYISDRNFKAANKLSNAIETATATLAKHPHLYRVGRTPGTREMVVHPNYLLIYQAVGRINILGVVHARQEYP